MKFPRTIVAAALLLLVACSSTPREPVPELYWPFPPERPRIKFVDYMSGSLDVVKRTDKLQERIFGDRVNLQLRKPSFIAVKDDTLYVTDINRVVVFDIDREKMTVTGLGVLRSATGIAAISTGTLYIGDSALRRVVILDPNSSNAKMVGEGLFDSPGGVAVDEPRGRFMVADAKRHDVKVFTLEGNYLFTIGKRGLEPGKFNFPYDVKVDGRGYIYVMDSGNFRVQIFDPDGQFVTAFGSVGTSPGQFARPKGIAVDSEGYIYAVDAAFGNFQIFDADGRLYLAVGENGLEPGRFLLPMGICVGENDKIYIVDQMNQRIQIFERLKYDDEKRVRPPRPGESGF